MVDKKFIKEALAYYEWCVASGLQVAKKKNPNILVGFLGQSYTYNFIDVKTKVNETITEIQGLVKHPNNKDLFADYQLKIIESMLTYISNLSADRIISDAMYWNSNYNGLISNDTAKGQVKKSLVNALLNPNHKYW